MPVTSVLDSTIHHAELGAGRPIVFLHGNPTSSYAWRNITPHLADRACTLAPDLIGMGASGKPDIAYDFADHARYLEAWFDSLDLQDVTLVGTDWGGVLALDYAARHPERIRGVAMFETFLKPLAKSDLSPQALERFETMNTPGLGEKLALEENKVLEMAFKGGVLNPLSDAAVESYRKPYPTPETRRPLLNWVRMFPIEGKNPELAARMEAYGAWMANTPDTPKLLLAFENSFTLAIKPEMVAWAEANIAGLTVRQLGDSGHHATEDRPAEIGGEIARWYDSAL